MDRGVVPPGRTTPRGRVGGRGQHTIVRCGHTGTDSPAWARLVWSLVGSGWDGGVVPVAVGSWVGLFGPWGGSSRAYHTPWSCGRSWSTTIVRCGHTGTDSPAWLVWSGLWWVLGGTVGWFRLRWAHGSGCLDRGVVPPGRTTPRGRVGGRGQHTIVGCGHTGTDSPAWSGLVWSGGVWVGRWGGSGCGGLMGRVVWTVGWFLPAVPHPVVVWEVVVNTRLWDVVTPGRIPRRGLVWSGLVGVWVGRWGGSGCGGLMGRVVWTVGWFLPVVPHPVVVWEVVVNTDCEMWSHRDGFPGVAGLVWSGGVWVGRWGGSGCGGLMGRVVWTAGWFLPVVPHPVVVWEVVVNKIVGCGHTGTDSPAWSGLVWSGGVWVGRWGGSGCGGLMGRVVWTVGWFLPAVPHPVVVWEVVVNTRLWDVVTPGRIPRRGLVWSGLVWCGVWVGRWGGSGCGGLIGRVVWTVGWFLPAVPHPVVVWEVVVNNDCEMWSHRDGFPGVVWSGLVWWGLGGTVGWFRLRWAHGSGCLDRGVVPPGRTTPRGRVGGRGQQRL